MSAQHTPGPWKVYPFVRGFVVLRGIKGEALTNDDSNEIVYDASRRDCFFTTEAAAIAAIAKATGSAS